jgi:hypothetical protein
MASSFNGTFVQHEKSAIQYIRPSANLGVWANFYNYTFLGSPLIIAL